MTLNLSILLAGTPDSAIVKPARITAGDIDRPAATFLSFYDKILAERHMRPEPVPGYHYLQRAVEQGYARIEGDNMVLVPIIPRHAILKHRGILDDRIKAILREQGVFGNPDIRHPTYLASQDWNGETYCELTDPQHEIILRIDTERLLERRTVFLDPEAIDEKVLHDNWTNELGKIFFVCGGIPKEAIVDAWMPYR